MPRERTLSHPPLRAATTGGMAARRFSSVCDWVEVEMVAILIDLDISPDPPHDGQTYSCVPVVGTIYVLATAFVNSVFNSLCFTLTGIGTLPSAHPPQRVCQLTSSRRKRSSPIIPA